MTKVFSRRWHLRASNHKILFTYIYVCMFSARPPRPRGTTEGQQTDSVHANSFSQNSNPERTTVSNENTTCIGSSFWQHICYCAALLKRMCTSDSTRTISRTIKEKMLLILHSFSKASKFEDLHTRHSLSPRSRRTFGSHRPVSSCRPWQPVLNLLSNLLFDQHFISDKHAACSVLFMQSNIQLRTGMFIIH